MNTERTDLDPAERKLDEWAEESRRRRGDSPESAATAGEPSTQPERTDVPPAEAVRRAEHRDGAEATSTADLARAGGPYREASTEEPDGEDRPTALFAEEEASGLRQRWLDVQTEFVDDPRQAVQRADALVAELMQQLAETFASERSDLEQQWDRGGEVSTEDLRIALRRYRSFFDRLLSL
jgi:hypothetical protein